MSDDTEVDAMPIPDLDNLEYSDLFEHVLPELATQHTGHGPLRVEMRPVTIELPPAVAPPYLLRSAATLSCTQCEWSRTLPFSTTMNPAINLATGEDTDEPERIRQWLAACLEMDLECDPDVVTVVVPKSRHHEDDDEDEE